MKTKKKVPDRNKEEVNNNDNNKNSWPDLPQRLIKHIQKHPTLMQSINFGSATKSLRSPTNKRQHCYPREQTQPYWLCVSDEYDRNDFPPQFCSMLFPRYWFYYSWRSKRWRPRPLPWKHFWGCCQGHLVVRPLTPTSKLYIVNPIDDLVWNLPDLEDEFPFKCTAISSSPSDYGSKKRCAVMVVTGISCPAFMFYRLRVVDPKKWITQVCKLVDPHEWIKQDCTLVDPYDNHFTNRKYNQKQAYMRFTNAIGFDGKFYALSSQGTLVVIEDVVDVSDTEQRRFEITRLGKTRAVPSFVPYKGFRECLMESSGEILLVFLVCGKTANVVDDVEVFRLCLEELSWTKMEILDGRTLFIGSDCCTSVCADKVGCKGNCVYFSQRRVVDGWWEYDMEVGRISPVWTDIDHSRTAKHLEWDEPIAEEYI